MILDTAELDENSDYDCDVCIVGAGPAGLTIANELSRTRLRTCVLEIGGLKARNRTKVQILADQFGIPIDDSKLRNRCFGGGSNAWGGLSGLWFRSRPMDPLDFEERSWIPESGWPIDYCDLVPYYDKACEALGIMPLRKFDSAEYDASLHPMFHNDMLHTAIFQMSSPMRFGRFYADQFKNSQSLKVFLNATVVSLNEAESKPTIESLTFVAPNGKHHRITSKWFVLACGGLETPRLLLASRNRRHCGIGNEHDLVGRYFMQHPKGRHGLVRLKQGMSIFPFLWRLNAPQNVRLHAGITLSDSLQRQYKLPNHCLVFNPIHAWYEGYPSDAYRAIKRAWQRRKSPEDQFTNIARHFRAHAESLWGEKKIGLGNSSTCLTFTIMSHMEQVPDRTSRVFLSQERNELGQWKLHSDWRINSFEKEALCQLHNLTKSTIERCNIGTLETNLDTFLDNWPVSEDSAHYIGTTRMHNDPKHGVTDGNCRVHSVKNLYISGSSVFPTGGHANPTLTILALAFRLANHLLKLEYPDRAQ